MGTPAEMVAIEEGRVRLLATQCGDCGSHSFPLQDSCARCGGTNVVDVPLPDHGSIWSYTVQTFRPPVPPYAPRVEGVPFEPFGVAMVAFEGGLCVQGRLTEPDSTKLKIGMRVETVLVPIDGDADELVYAFRPIEEA